jgi:hypothetical protein
VHSKSEIHIALRSLQKFDRKEVFTDDPVPFKKKKWFDFSLPSFLKGN